MNTRTSSPRSRRIVGRLAGGALVALAASLVLLMFPGVRTRVVRRAQRLAGIVGVEEVPIRTPPRTLPHTSPERARLRCDLSARPVSPYIFGVASLDAARRVRARAYRWGGNPTSRYNWKLATYNTANDWYFRNVRVADYRDTVRTAGALGVFSVLTVPMIGWVAKDDVSSSFPVDVVGAQEHVAPEAPNAGNGRRPDGSELPAPPPERTSVPAPPAFVGAWVRSIRAADVAHGKRRVHGYILDNEPALWSSTHRDVHPRPVSYDELLERTVAYARALRRADPDSLIMGPAEWGWPAYFDSQRDLAASWWMAGADRAAHGDIPLIPYYLQTLAAHERRTGERLLDVLDLHFYPQGEGIYGPATDADTAARRIRAVRGLWDPEYVDESWVRARIQLIPRMRAWVDENYPSLRLSIGEWNFGAEQHISGGLAVAEALGRFAQEGLDYAFYWLEPPADSPAAWAFRAYTDFDGRGGHFLRWFVPSESPADVSLFASRDAEGQTFVLVFVNPSPDVERALELETTSCGALHQLSRYELSALTPRLERRAQAASPSAARGTVALPPYSVTVLQLARQTEAPRVDPERAVP